MTSPDSHLEKETFLIHDISPQLERELMRRARDNDRDTSAEASEIIEKHIAEEDDDMA
jgi:adenylate kinase